MLSVECLYPTPIRNNQMDDTHVAPLGLGSGPLSPGYRHVAPLGLNESIQ